MTETIEDSARRIADQGRGELLNQLRPAFEQAAQAHADVLELSPERVQEMIERAAERATGLQWRHALATVAARELDISLAQALSHPAVERAHEIAGAPEDTVPTLREASQAPAQAVPAASAEPAAQTELIAHPDPEREEEHEQEAGPDREQQEGQEQAAGADLEEEAASDERIPAEPRSPREPHQPPEPRGPRRAGVAVVRMAVVHVGGIANLAPGEPALELRLSPAGLDIGRGNGEMVGRLSWREIRSIEVPPPRGLRRKRQGGSQLVVRTPHGEAVFEVPELSADELREQVRPVLARHQRRLRAR